MNKIRLMKFALCTDIIAGNIVTAIDDGARQWTGASIEVHLIICVQPLAIIGSQMATIYGDFVEEEVWIGDIAGTAVAPFPFIGLSSGTQHAWLLADFEGTVLGEYEGTLVIMSTYSRPSEGTHWHGEWMIISGTGELENLRGYGTAWGPGSTNEDDGIIDIYYQGEIFFLESVES